MKTDDSKENNTKSGNSSQDLMNLNDDIRNQLNSIIEENKRLTNANTQLLLEKNKLVEDIAIYLEEIKKYDVFNNLKPHEIEQISNFIPFFFGSHFKLKIDVDELSSMIQPHSVDRCDEVMVGVFQSWLAFFASDIYFSIYTQLSERNKDVSFSLDSLNCKFYNLALKTLDASLDFHEIKVFLFENIENFAVIAKKLFLIRQITNTEQVIDFFEKYQLLFYATKEAIKISYGILNGD